ncbi:site-specific DNA-methyltransferase [Archaeoglobus sp.]
MREREFYKTLRDLFVGAEVEGRSGYIKLMGIKSKYFEKVFAQLRKDIDKELRDFPEFREELFDKLYSFFKRYFSETGSVHFCFTPFRENVWTKVYSNNNSAFFWTTTQDMALDSLKTREYERIITTNDVALFWKTRDLYYVKTDRLWRSMRIEFDGYRFFFDASEIEHRKTYEKKEIIFELKSVENDGTVVFKVIYSERGRKTKLNDILRELKKRNIEIDEEVLRRAFRIFEKQNEVDYFIHKNPNAFLKEQFGIWLKNYLLDEESIFDEKRLKELKALKKIAHKIIDFISQFEDEVRKIWEKPKFVLNSNYVITLDKIKELCGEEFLEKEVIPEVLRNERQLKEWKELFDIKVKEKRDLVERNTLEGKGWKKLPVDTKYFDGEFKWKLIEKICEAYNLDEILDGWLIKSENWQALNTILPKFKGKVRMIYIDPPFNKEQNADYEYNVKYKDSTWITMLENRITLAKEILSDGGSIYVRCDYNGNMYVRLLMDEIFGKENFRNEIIVNRTKKIFEGVKGFNVATDSLFFYTKSDDFLFNPIFKERTEQKWINMHSPGERHPPERVIFGRVFYPPKGRHWTFTQEKINQLIKEGRIRINESKEYVDMLGNKVRGMPQYLTSSKERLDSNWTDVPGYSSVWKFQTENSEHLLKRVIEASSSKGDIVMDFFLGSGTTTAVAQKLGRRWIGIEMGEHFHTVILPRMKKVLAGENSGISKEVNWQGGGFFKYYELEQFEQTLRKTCYKDAEPFFDMDSNEIYSEYVFLKDEKLLYTMELDYKNNKIRVDPSKLYSNVDIAETLSNLRGKFIKKLARDYVEFEDGERIYLKELDWKLVKPLIWW